ncbi:universal stress protein [Streptomyces hesseae]|uniref:Universal stress protein n=1 Tax=Streptomyces hesseae TaxID=3075519 RepID=A0ABU2SKJ4_9ACTN|nr:universal stress protein [Streptomyces sp. DSM 40473]MDT0449496.1 universal stress protein [Streptomyces sp. DSM 40473]
MARTRIPRQGRVLAGFDGSVSVPVLERAADEAVRRGTELEILCGWPWDRGRAAESPLTQDGRTLYETARQRLDRAVARAHARAGGLRVIPTVTTEIAAEALVRSGRTSALTVLGTRRQGGLPQRLTGSVTSSVAARSTNPVLVVRGGPEPERGCVLVGFASDTDLDALRFGFQEAARRGARLRVLHAWSHLSSPGARPPARLWREDLRLLSKVAKAVPEDAVAVLRADHPEIAVDTVAVCQEAGRGLVEESRSAAVVVIAAHRRGRRSGPRLGTVAQALLNHAHCPVVLVPGI